MVPFPDPFPDEILYSVCARFSDHVRYPNKKMVLREFFGTKNASPIIDLPCHLNSFIEQLPLGHSYTIDIFINQHTLLPLYSPFLPRERFMAVREQMITSDGQRLHRRMGITNSLTPRIPWLRYCPLCLQEDKKNFGESYWHRLHQVPGVEVCPLHATFIENSSIGARRPYNIKHLISAEQIVPDITVRRTESSRFQEILIDIAKNISYLLNHLVPSLPPQQIRQRYHDLLSQRGFISDGGLVRNVELLEAFVNYYTPALLNQFNCTMRQEQQAYNSWLARLVTCVRDVHHPLHHILAIVFLGSTVETFISENFKPPVLFSNGPWPCLNPVCEHYQQKQILTSQIKKRWGKRNEPLGVFTCTCGFTYCRTGPNMYSEDVFRKDKILAYGDVWEKRLQELWLNPSVTRRDIARYLGVAEQTVTRQAARLSLPIPRKSPVKSGGGRPRVVKDVEKLRTQWLAFIENEPQKGLTDLYEEAPALYNWLYRHDREWFIAHRPLRKPFISRKKEQTIQSINEELQYKDEMSRDTLMAESIKIVSHQLLMAPGRPKKISMRAIFLHVPHLSWLRSEKPGQIPLSIQALNEVVETREAFAVRRVWWVAQQYRQEQIYPGRREFRKRASIQYTISLPVVKQAFDEAMIMLSSYTQQPDNSI